MKIHFKIFFIAAFVLITHNLSALSIDSAKVTTNRSRFSIGIIASPEYCYRSLSAGSDANSYTQSFIASRNNREIPKVGYTVGVNVMYEISKRISVESGINYSDKGYQFDFSGLTFGDMIDPRFGFIYQTQSVEDNIDTWYYHYTNLDIPFKIVYTFPGKKIRFTASGGFIANIFLDAFETIGSSTVKREDDFNDVGFSAVAATGAVYNFNNRFRLSIMPAFQYSLTNLRNSPVNEHLWSAGVNVGGFYRF